MRTNLLNCLEEGQSALQKGRMEGMFDCIITEMDLKSEICLRFELEKTLLDQKLKIVSDYQTLSLNK